MGLPNWSVTLTVTAGVNAEPAVTDAGGPCTNEIMLAVAALMLKFALVVLASPALLAVVKLSAVPAWLMAMSLKVALPVESVVRGLVPEAIVLPLRVRVMVVPLCGTAFPNWS